MFDNKEHVLLPGLFVRVRIPKQVDVESLLVPDIALGNNQQGRYLLVVNDKNVVEQRQVEVGELVDGALRIINERAQARTSASSSAASCARCPATPSCRWTRRPPPLDKAGK